LNPGRNGNLQPYSTLTDVLPVRHALWPVRVRGLTTRGRSTCGGTMWRPNLMVGIPSLGMLKH